MVRYLLLHVNGMRGPNRRWGTSVVCLKRSGGIAVLRFVTLWRSARAVLRLEPPRHLCRWQSVGRESDTSLSIIGCSRRLLVPPAKSASWTESPTRLRRSPSTSWVKWSVWPTFLRLGGLQTAHPQSSSQPWQRPGGEGFRAVVCGSGHVQEDEWETGSWNVLSEHVAGVGFVIFLRAMPLDLMFRGNILDVVTRMVVLQWRTTVTEPPYNENAIWSPCSFAGFYPHPGL